ncbi:hypothetical protein MHBO_004171, partial [Bonamia ostreae]
KNKLTEKDEISENEVSESSQKSDENEEIKNVEKLNNSVLEIFEEDKPFFEIDKKSEINKNYKMSEHNKNEKKSFGLFNYMDEHLKKRNLEVKQKKERIVEKSNIYDAFDKNFLNEKNLSSVNELVYPILAKIMKQNRRFKTALEKFLEFNFDNGNPNDTNLPFYNTDAKSSLPHRTFSSMLKFRLLKSDYIYFSEDISSYDNAEDLSAKKALCELEEKGLLFVPNFREREENVPQKYSENFTKCKICKILIPVSEIRLHFLMCSSHLDQQKSTFEVYKETSKFSGRTD